jgi:hypothetical protein
MLCLLLPRALRWTQRIQQIDRDSQFGILFDCKSRSCPAKKTKGGIVTVEDASEETRFFNDVLDGCQVCSWVFCQMLLPDLQNLTRVLP